MRRRGDAGAEELGMDGAAEAGPPWPWWPAATPTGDCSGGVDLSSGTLTCSGPPPSDWDLWQLA